GTPIAYTHSMWTSAAAPAEDMTASWNTTLSIVWWSPMISRPFSSTTLPTLAFLNVMFEPEMYSAEPFGVTPLASTLTPSHVVLSASMFRWSTRLPAMPRNVTALLPETSWSPV